MPKNTCIKSILVIGSGPIMIGQACEFDYSGTQALKALREEGYRVILVNSNPATIMTDPEMADATYIEPITPEYIEKIINLEKPCAIIPTLGGQTSLNCALELYKNKVLEKHGVQLIGASYEAINIAEDRTLFREKMLEIGLDVPKSISVQKKEEIKDVINYLGLPLILRSSFSLGGMGAQIVNTEEEAINAFEVGMIFDEALIGWKEFELEVVRDKNDNCIVVCGVENVDPLGIHTGDSITVAPIQTLTDKQYQRMRDAAFKVLRAVGVDTGGSNVQFAIHPKTGRMVVIEMNPRVSRSSALVSKATGFPIAKIAAKLAVGYTLDELKNEITTGVLPASFEPSIDYVVVKIPRFHNEKFNANELSRGPQMRSVGEVMGIGSTFRESLQHALCSLEIGSSGLDLFKEKSDDEIREMLKSHLNHHIYAIAEAFRRGLSINEIHNLSFVDPWFLFQISEIINLEKTVENSDLLQLKKNGFSDKRIAELTKTSETIIRSKRKESGVVAVYKHVDSCAGEFNTSTSYMYSTYQEYCESSISARKKIIIIGSGPNRIGQGLEFDYICVKAIQAFSKHGFETIMLNCNPETVSTDYDVADKLYFIPLTFEKVMDIIETEKPLAVALQFGGQTPLNLVDELNHAGVKLIGLNADVIHLTEDRDKFRELLNKLGLKQPKNIAINHLDELETVKSDLQFPVIIRPSYVLGGRGMEVVADFPSLQKKILPFILDEKHPVLIEEFLENAIEVDVDAISDGENVFIPLFLEHIEAVGVHSGDSACISSAYHLTKAMTTLIHKQTEIIAKSLKLTGLFNIQFAVKDQQVYIIEVNPRASRTTPFISKATGLPLIDIAVNCMLGKTLKEQKCVVPVKLPFYCVKEAVLPFKKFMMCDPVLGPEMKSTGEVMGIGRSPYEAYIKTQQAAGQPLPEGKFTLLISGLSESSELLKTIKELGCHIQSDIDLRVLPELIISLDCKYLSYAVKNNIPYASTIEAADIILKSIVHQTISPIKSLQSLYKEIIHPFKTNHLLTGMELKAQDLQLILEMAILLKKNPEQYSKILEGKSLAMIFDKPSFRTRLSFSLAIQSLGGKSVESLASNRKHEVPQDTISVLNNYCDFLMIRTHEDEIVEKMAQHSSIPIINGLSALHHPCQILADLLTLYEYFGYLEELTLSYIGDGNNILHSLMLICPLLGVQIKYCCPSTHQPNPEIFNHCDQDKVKKYLNPEEAVAQSHAIYTDVWTSMGFEGKNDEKDFEGFQVNEKLMSYAKPEAIFMHCMPMERDKEVSSSLADTPASVIFEQSANRLHVQKALLLFLGGFSI